MRAPESPCGSKAEKVPLHENPKLLHENPKLLHENPKLLHENPKLLHENPKLLHENPKLLHENPKPKMSFCMRILNARIVTNNL
jgi:hypothetical protein